MSRNLPLDLSFLEPEKTYEAVIYRDASNADWDTNPEAYVIEKKTVTRQQNQYFRWQKVAVAPFSW